MVEITRSNFNEKYEDIACDLSNATFIAIDCEFSGGLHSSPVYKPSLFDNGAERYEKLRHSFDRFICVQIGLSAFRFLRDENKYTSTTYNIYIFPCHFLSIDRPFMCQASSLQFLLHHNFNFNKFVKEGVPYLNESDETKLRQELEGWSSRQWEERILMMEDENVLQSVCSNVSLWLSKAEEGAEMILENSIMKRHDVDLAFLLHKELRSRFHNIWTFSEGDEGIKVKKVGSVERSELEENEKEHGTLENNMINFMLGFTKVFRLLSTLQKPIVGHNLLLDLVLLYSQFYRPLPAKYSEFKKNVHKLFPIIYDTKVLGSHLKEVLSKTDKWQTNILIDMYEYFKHKEGKNLAVCFPAVESVYYKLDDMETKFHEAGWDSFCTGFCFVHIAHYLAIFQYGCLSRPRSLVSAEHLGAVSSLKNTVNVVRASITHIVFDDADPKSHRPPLLFVEAKKADNLTNSEVVRAFAQFGTVDVKQHTKKSVLVAVASHGHVKTILESFRDHPHYSVKIYSLRRYLMSVCPASLWTLGSVICGAVVLLLLPRIK